MGLFDDKKYDSMDDISKMIEPWENPFDPIMEKIPEECDVSPEIIASLVNAYDIESSLFNLILKVKLTHDEYNKIRDSGLLEKTYVKNVLTPGVLDMSVSNDFSLTLSTLETTGSFKVVKTYKSIPESKLKELIDKYAHRNVVARYSADSYKSEYLRAIYEVTTGKPYENDNKSKKALMFNVRLAVINLLTEDRWRIRSFDLALRLCNWIEMYCRTGNAASFANIMKIKIMTHSGRAIYSVGEEV